MKSKKLVLFDIDGTLIYHVGRKTSWVTRYTQALNEVYGVKVLPFDPIGKHEGSIEQKIAWEELSPLGINRQTIRAKFPRYLKRRVALFDEDAGVEQLYKAIPDACTLARRLGAHPDRYIVGVLTGNATSIALWKLSHAGVPDVFHFGLYGEEADDRIALSHLAFDKASQELGVRLTGEDIVVIGDTVHDIRCGRAIGAVTIGVTTGGHDRGMLAKEHPDLLVDSLMDPRVLGMFGVNRLDKKERPSV